MKKNDHVPEAPSSSRISLGMVFIVALTLACLVGLNNAGNSEAVTYNMQSGTGVLNGITANYGVCGTNNTTGGVVVPMNTSGTNACTTGRAGSTGAVGTSLLLVISDTPYAQATNITGVNVTGNLRDYTTSETASPGTVVGIQYQLGYVLSGTFTSFGSVNEARDWSTQADWTTNLSSISGTAPSGSSLAIQVLKQNANTIQYRYYFTSTSLVLNVTEAGSCPRSAPTVSISPSSQNVAQGASGSYTLTVTNNDDAACAASTFNLAWTNTPGMPNANFSTTGQSGTIGPISPGASSQQVFTHDAAVGASISATQQTAAGASDANHTAVTSNTVTSTVVAATPAVPVGNWPLFLIVIVGMVTYAVMWRRKQGKTSS